MHIVGSIPAAVAGGSDREDENWKDILGYPRILFGYLRISLEIILGYSIGYHLDTYRISGMDIIWIP